MDIPKCPITVQFMVPKTISDYTQHFGCAGRDGIPSISVLLVEPSVYQVLKKKQLVTKFTGKGGSKNGRAAVPKNSSQATQKINVQPSITTAADSVTHPVIKRKHSDEDQAQEPTEGSVDSQGSSPDRKDLVFANVAADQNTPEDSQPEIALDATAIAELEEAFDVDREQEFRKNMDPDMRELCITCECLQRIADAYYDNPPRVRGSCLFIQIE
jgi:hypothetical protein